MSYEDLSDFEINKAVSVALGEKIPEGWEDSPWYYKTENTSSELNGDGSQIEKTIIRGYCDNPSAAWPIIVENEISLEVLRDNEGWLSRSHKFEREFHTLSVDKDPLRAAMICFLKIKESGK